MYAVVKISGQQWKVKEGDVIEVDRLSAEVGKKFTISDVLLTMDDKGGKAKVGTPFVKGASVDFDVVENKRGEKLQVVKFKPKSRYTKRSGHRSELTVLECKKVTT